MGTRVESYISRRSFYAIVLGLLLLPLLLNLAFIYNVIYIADPRVFEWLICSVVFFTMWGLGVLLFRELKQRKRVVSILLLTLIMTALGGLTHLWQLEERSFWLDEEESAALIYGYNKNFPLRGMTNIVEETAVSAQSPASFYLMYLSSTHLGFSAKNLRLPSALLGGASAGVFFLLLVVLSRNLLLSAIGSLLFSIDPFLHYFFQEARPYALGIFSCCVFLLCFILYNRSKINYYSLSCLWGATALLLFSIGFQPMVFLLSVCVLMLVRAKRRPLHFLGAICSFAFGAAIYLPYQLNMLFRAIEYLPHHQDGLIEAKPLSVEVTNALVHLYEGHWQVCALMFFLLLCTITKLLKTKHSSYFERCFLEFGLLLFLFLISAVIVFVNLISWHFWDRYLLFSLPIFYVVVIMGFLVMQQARLFKFAPNPISKSIRSLSLSALLLVCIARFSILPLCYGQTAIPYQGHAGRSFRARWVDLYKFAATHTVANDVFFLFPLDSPEHWSPKAFPAATIYYPEAVSRNHARIESVWETDLGPWEPRQIMKQLKAVSDIKTLFLVFPMTRFVDSKRNPIDLYLDTQTQLQLDPSYHLIALKANGAPTRSLFNFLKKLQENVEASALLYQVNMTLVALAVDLKDWRAAKQNLDQLKPYLSFGHIDQFYRHYSTLVERHI